MTQQEYQHIRDLAWILLSDSKIDRLPVDIAAIARKYDLDGILDYSKTRYFNTMVLSEKILGIYGYSTEDECVRSLTVRLLSPMIVLKMLDIKSPAEIKRYCEIPTQIAEQRFERYKTLLKRNKFEQSGLESRVAKNFEGWVKELRSQSSSSSSYS